KSLIQGVDVVAVLIGVDMGTTHCKVVAYSEHGDVLALVRERTPVNTPHPGWAEYDPDVMWSIVEGALRQVTSSLPSDSGPIAGIGVSGMAEAGLLIDKTGKPLTTVHSWYDQRAI